MNAEKVNSFFGTRNCNGIHNVGNTCYLSTSLQCLGHCLHFVYPVIANKVDPAENPVSYQLREIYKTIWLTRDIASPHPLLKELAPKLKDIMSCFQQNDAMEFIMLLLDILITEQGTKLDGLQPEKSLKGIDKLTNILNCGWVNSHKLAHSYLCDVVYGQTVNQTKCKLCGDIEHRGEVFSSISLALPEGAESTRLADLLATFFEQEQVKRNCDGCKLHNVAATNVARLWRMPQVLVIHLKRFNADNKKVRTAIDVPHALDLDEYVLSKGDFTYELKAIACHSGDTNYGHYFALVKNPSNKWHILDDEQQPMPIEAPEKVASGQYYVLFYEAT